jgi:YHS domain-containing protein
VSLLAYLLRLVAFALIAWLVGRLMSSLLTRSPAGGQARNVGGSPPPRQAPSGERLVRDPVCGVALPASRALSDGSHHFCSEDCRGAFRDLGADERPPVSREEA